MANERKRGHGGAAQAPAGDDAGPASVAAQGRGLPAPEVEAARAPGPEAEAAPQAPAREASGPAAAATDPRPGDSAKPPAATDAQPHPRAHEDHTFDDKPARRSKPKQRRALHLPRRFRKSRPGSAAGIEPHDLPPAPASTGATRITCIDYSAERHQVQEVTNLAEFIARHRPEWATVRWINVDGIGDLGVVRAIAEKYHLHPLAIEDLLHVPQRPKVQAYEEADGYQARLFVIVRMLDLKEGQLLTEQVSLFVGHKTLITFQESPGDVWDPIRERLKAGGSRLRSTDASFLAYSLIDAVVDQAFPILEHFGDRLELVEDMVLKRPTQESFQEIHRLKRELLLLRRAMWPMREVVQRLAREPHECFSEVTQTYIRDVYDHAVQIIDILETYREIATGLTETYMSAISNRMNEIMKVLTIIGTIFIPLTFLAGVYGMNFHHFPELEWWWAYPAFWVICGVTAVSMVTWFRRRGWL